MPIIFAAPFLLAAGLVFTILSLIPRARRWGIPIPTGILATAPSLIAFLLIGVVVEKFWPGRGDSATDVLSAHAPMMIYAQIAVAGSLAILGGVVAGWAARLTASLLPALLLRLAVFVAAWCSYFVMMAAVGVVGTWYGLWGGQQNWILGLPAFGIQALLCFIAAFFMAKRSEDFRPRNLRLPWGSTFKRRNEVLTESHEA